jgi:hypothetical protein
LSTITFLGNFRVSYTSESHHASSLKSLGHKVIKLQESEATADQIYKSASESDIFVWVHTHGWKTPGILSMEEVLERLNDKGVITLTYHLDLWFGLKRQKDLDKDPVYKNIQHFFTVDKQMANWFNQQTNVTGHYLPAGVFDQECYTTNKRKVHDVVFVGSKKYHAEWTYRPKLVNWLGDVYGKGFEHYGGDGIKVVRGKELNNLYASTKVVVGDTLCPNFTYENYWSDRIYETIGRGGFIIHPYIPGLEKEFVDGEHVVFYEYKNLKQLKELIDYYLVHNDEREKIRLAGHNLVKENYTYKNRWQHIMKEIEK